MISNLDDIDQRIIRELRRNGRQANTEIARRVGVSEATVRNRIQRLVGEGKIQIAAVTNLPRLGFDLHVVIGVNCEPGRALEIAGHFAAMDEVRFASCVSGPFDVLLTASFRSRNDLFAFLTDRIRSVPGIVRTETMHELRVVKRDYDYVESASAEDEAAFVGAVPEPSGGSHPASSQYSERRNGGGNHES